MITVRTIKPEKKEKLSDSINIVLGDKIDEIHSVDQMVKNKQKELIFIILFFFLGGKIF